MLEGIFSLVGWVFSLHPLILIVLAVALMYIAMKIIKMAMKVVFTAVVFGLMPVAAFIMGFDITLTFSSILGSAVFGIIAYFAYHSVRTGYKIIRIILSPFRKLFGDKPKKKVVIKEIQKEKN